MELNLINIMGITSLIFYIMFLVFSDMKKMRIMSYLSVVHDAAYGLVIGVMPKVFLNLVVGALNTYRYAKDFTKAKKGVIYTLAGIMIAGLLYFIQFAVLDFIANPSLAIGLNWLDTVLIMTALYMTKARNFQYLILLSGIVGGASYIMLDIWPMIIINVIKIVLMVYKLFIEKK